MPIGIGRRRYPIIDIIAIDAYPPIDAYPSKERERLADRHRHHLDDRLAGDGRGARFASGLPIHLGQDGTGRYGHNFNGFFDELAFWKRALSDAEIRQDSKYGYDFSVPIDLTFKDCSISFPNEVPEFIRGANVRSIVLENLKVEGVKGPLLRTWQGETDVRAKGVKGVGADVEKCVGPWAVQAI